MIQTILIQIRQRQDCEIMAPTGLPLLEDGLVMPPDIQAFYSVCGGARLRRCEFDDSSYWMWRIANPSEFLPIGIVANSYQIPLSYLKYTPANNFYRIVCSEDHETDVAICVGGQYSGKCILLENDTLVPPMAASVLADSLPDLLSKLLHYDSLSISKWVSLSNKIYLMRYP